MFGEYLNSEFQIMSMSLENDLQDKSKKSIANNIQTAVRYFHPAVGCGDFIKKYNGKYGMGMIIRLDNGREWFAPISEFTPVVI